MENNEIAVNVPRPDGDVISYELADQYIPDGPITWDDLKQVCASLAHDIWQLAWLAGDAINRYLAQEGISDNNGIVDVCQRLQSDTGLKWMTLYKLTIASQRVAIEQRPADMNPTLVYEITAGADSQDKASALLETALGNGVNTYTQARRAKAAQTAGVVPSDTWESPSYTYFADTGNLYVTANNRIAWVCSFNTEQDNLARFGRDEILRIIRATRREREV